MAIRADLVALGNLIMAVVDPSSAPTITQAIINLMPVIIGGLLTLAGGIIKSVTDQFLKKRSDRTQRKREKLEELATLVCEMEEWLENYKEESIFRKEGITKLSPLIRVEMICRVHFPELKKEVNDFVISTKKYEKWILGAAQEALEKQQDPKRDRMITNRHMENYSQVYELFTVSRNTLLQSANGVMQKLD